MGKHTAKELTFTDYMEKLDSLTKERLQMDKDPNTTEKDRKDWGNRLEAMDEEYYQVVIDALENHAEVNPDDPRKFEIEQLLAYFTMIKQRVSSGDLLNSEFLPMVNNNSINDFMAISVRDFKEDKFTNTASYTNSKGIKYEITNYDKLQGELGTPARKLLDTAILYLTYNNYRHTLSRATVEIPLIEYGEANGYSLTPRVMPTDKEQEAENRRVDDRLKEFKKRLRRDLTDLMHVQFSKDNISVHGKNAGDFDVGVIISRARIATEGGKQYIRINFDADMAEYFISSSFMQYPTILLKHDNKNPNAYAIGRKIALQNSMDNNVAAGTDNTLKVKTLLEAAPEIVSIDTLREKGRRDWKAQIKNHLEKAINRNVDIGYIIRWEYRNARTGKTYTPETANALTWEEYNNLDVDFILIDNPEKEKRLQRKEEEKALAADNPGQDKTPKSEGKTSPKNKK